MKTLTSIAVAGLMALAPLAGSASTASADGKGFRGSHWHKKGPWPGPYHRVHRYKPPPPRYVHRYYYRDGPYWGAGAGFVAGTALGLTFGALAASPRVYYEPPPPYPGLSWTEAHVEWCLDRYRSYNPATNTFLGYDGYYHECVSPF